MRDPSDLDMALVGVNPAAPSTRKFARLDTYLAATASAVAADVVSATISKAGNFSVRATQSSRAQNARLFVGVVTDPGEVEGSRTAARAHVAAGLCPAVLLVQPDGTGWAAPWGVAAEGAPERTLSGLSGALDTNWETVAARPLGSLARQRAVAPTAVISARALQIDDRVRRMLRTSVASRPAVLLVGPPGTGKTELVHELVDEVASDPSVVSMTSAHDANFVTPDESWSVRELIGAETVDDNGRLRFAPGAVLDAVTQDRWLVLDEANRADMDRIFGGLLTWLSGKAVTVGRLAGDPGAGPVNLGWSGTPGSVVDGLELLRTDPPSGEAVSFLAGTEWRLLGTYNALDAHRVFRFGLALGRRFAQVPVPPLDRAGFAAALSPYLDHFDAAESARVAGMVDGLYGAHLASTSAATGPAAFLAIPGYVAAGLTGGVDLTELVAEAYLTALGTWLARLEEDELDSLGHLLRADGVLGDQWLWVRSQLGVLR